MEALNGVIETMISTQIDRNTYGDNVAKMTAKIIDKIIKNG